MTNLTPEIIESATDEQLAELVAVHCMGLHIESGFYGVHPVKYWANKNGDNAFPEFNQPPTLDGWQPHLPTEKGKAQCWDLEEKYNLSISDKGIGYTESDAYAAWINWVDFKQIGKQKATMKASLYAEIEG